MRRYLPLLLALLAFGLRLLPTPRTIDDAFITFRYARNVLEGQGFVYNPGEHVLGTTTPLYTGLMASLAALTTTRDFPWLALIVNALADAATCWLLIQLGHKLSGHRAFGYAWALLWAVAPMSVTFAIGGMETSVFIFLLILTAWLYLTDHWRWAACTTALLLLTRPDGLLFAAPLGLAIFLQRLRASRSIRHWPWAEAGIFCATLAPWALFATWYFGSPLPHSIAAKTLAYRLDANQAFIRLLQHYGTPFFENEVYRTQALLGLTIFLGYLILGLGGTLALLRQQPRAWPLALYPWLYFLAFALANPLIFRWYLAPPLPFYFLILLFGVAQIIALTKRNPRLIFVPTALWLALSLNAWALHPDHGPTLPAPKMAWHQLELYYTQIGQQLAPQIAQHPQAVIAAGDVGALGYYSRARILDTVGLMSPQTAAYFPLDPSLYVINYAAPPQLILDAQPDYVVLLEVYGRLGLFADPRFQATYTLQTQIPTDIYGSTGLLVFARQP